MQKTGNISRLRISRFSRSTNIEDVFYSRLREIRIWSSDFLSIQSWLMIVTSSKLRLKRVTKKRFPTFLKNWSNIFTFEAKIHQTHVEWNVLSSMVSPKSYLTVRKFTISPNHLPNLLPEVCQRKSPKLSMETLIIIINVLSFILFCFSYQ